MDMEYSALVETNSYEYANLGPPSDFVHFVLWFTSILRVFFARFKRRDSVGELCHGDDFVPWVFGGA